MTERYDVVVVGAGPAGSTAARVAAERGARVLLLDGSRFPRYKTCGGGLIGTSLDLLPPSALAAVERRVASVSFSYRGRPARRVRSVRPFLALARREVLDQALVDAATAAGVEFRDRTRVTRVEEVAGGARLTGPGLEVEAGAAVGADGASGVVGRWVGVRTARVDLGLEVELAGGGEGWTDRVHLDWGRDPGTYGWVFPKGDRLTVGVIERRGRGDATRRYLARLLEELGLADRERLQDSGHLTRWRERDSPVRRGPVLVAGDAAGLLEPWTREGISFALRSGRAAGAAAARSASDPSALADYERYVREELEPEQRAGSRLLRLFEYAPWLVHLGVTRSGRGARRFVRFARGEAGLGLATRGHR